jgi:hypothetical protein
LSFNIEINEDILNELDNILVERKEDSTKIFEKYEPIPKKYLCE